MAILRSSAVATGKSGVGRSEANPSCSEGTLASERINIESRRGWRILAVFLALILGVIRNMVAIKTKFISSTYQ